MKLRHSSFIGGMLCALWLSGCATPYQKQSAFHLEGGGFGEKKLSESAYWVYFSGNGYATKDRVTNFWIYRCAELTVQNGFQYMFLRPGENAPVGLLDGVSIMPATYQIDSTSRVTTAPAIYRPDSSVRLTPVHSSGGYTTYTYIPGGTITTWNSKGTALMYHDPLPDELVWALDAQKVLDLLGPYVTSDGSVPAPTLNALFKGAFVAHEKITFAPDSFSIKADPAELQSPGTISSSPINSAPHAPPSSARELRSEQDIRDRFDNLSISFHSLFRERKRIEKHDDAGSVVLGFTITPNGMVTHCQVVSTTFTDRAFADALASLVCKMSFPPRDLATTVVPSFPITFTPVTKLQSL